MADTERPQTPEEEVVLSELIQRVKNFSPEQIRSSEVAGPIREAWENGLDLVARTIVEESQNRQLTPMNIFEEFIWPINDFARTVLSDPPLPPQEFMYEENETVPPEAVVADQHNWWEELSLEQKQALSEIVGLDLTKADNYIPPEGEENAHHVLTRTQKTLTVSAEGDLPETTFYPTLIWNWHHGPAVTCLPVVGGLDPLKRVQNDGEFPTTTEGAGS